MHTIESALERLIALNIHTMSRDQLLVLSGAIISDELALELEPTPTQAVPEASISEPRKRFSLIRGNTTEGHTDIVADSKTGLQWTRATLGVKPVNFEAAGKACTDCRIGGHTDWRLPTIDELLSIVDRTRVEPAIDTDYFRCENGWYWSSTPYAQSPSVYAWVVSFDSGFADCSSRGSNGFVRAIRPGQ
jgi:hypothetical protein